jgi:hypothetical protein
VVAMGSRELASELGAIMLQKKKTPKKMLFSPLILLIKRVSVQSTIHHILVDI